MKLFKQNKKGFIGILFNPAAILLIAIVLLLALGLPNSPFRLAILSPFEFAGLSFTEESAASQSQCGGGNVDVSKVGEYLVVKSSHGGCGASYTLIGADVTGIDEMLVIADGNGYATASAQSGAGSNFDVIIKGTESGEVGAGFGVSVGSNEGGATRNQYFSPMVIKLKNNFDGTWSYLESLGVGDIFIVKQTSAIKGTPLLRIKSISSTGGEQNGRASMTGTIYNIVRKENAFALCKADKYAYDLNNDGRIATDGSECVELKTIVLNSEEAIKESYDEKLARITAELEAKNIGLTADITALKQQLTQQGISSSQVTSLQQQITQLEIQLATASDKTTIQSQIDALRAQQLKSGSLQDQLNALQAELKETKSVLADVQAKDRNVINVIEAQEQFKKPSFIKEFFNKIISFIKGLFR